ncbi:hypothetical protein STXM2123_5774 [Streptomyces sp. F-3]|nr:hypothetical protein STXM2123_5774 [Streptomyces sp. F-3]
MSQPHPPHATSAEPTQEPVTPGDHAPGGLVRSRHGAPSSRRGGPVGVPGERWKNPLQVFHIAQRAASRPDQTVAARGCVPRGRSVRRCRGRQSRGGEPAGKGPAEGPPW